MGGQASVLVGVPDDQRGLSPKIGRMLDDGRFEAGGRLQRRAGRAWESHDEGGTLPVTIAPRLDGAAMKLDDVAGDRQAKAETAGGRLAALSLLELIEDAREQFWSDALAGVAYGDLRSIRLSREFDVDRATRWRELDGVRQHVEHD